MMRLLAAILCMGLGGPVLADPPSNATGVTRDAPRATIPREEEDAADIWLRESAPKGGERR